MSDRGPWRGRAPSRGAGIEADAATWDRIWQVNVLAHVHAARAVLPSMLARGEGYLLSTASAAGLLSQIGDLPYSVTKHAAVSVAEWLAITYGDAGIKVSCLCPQGVRTNMLMGSSDDPAGAVVLASGDLLEPEQVADTVVAGLAEEAQQQPPRGVEDPHHGRRDPADDLHGRGHAAGDALGVEERDLLRHELAHDEGQVGEDDHHAVGSPRRVEVERNDAGVRPVRAHHRRMQLSGKIDVGGEAAFTGDQPEVLVARKPGGPIRHRRAVSEPYLDPDGDVAVTICSEHDWYRWVITREPPRAEPCPLYLVWVE